MLDNLINNGEPITEEVLRAIWTETQIQMEAYFSAQAPMPNIVGRILDFEPYQTLHQKLIECGAIDASVEEYGAPYVASSALSVKTHDYWLIVKCKGSSCSLEGSVKHEMYHIWEALFSLKLGTLTTKFGV